MSESREAVLKDRFYHEGEGSWHDVCTRVAEAWGTDAQHRQDVYHMMYEKRALPNTPAIANAGRANQMGSACYVLPINDSLTDGPSSIMQTLMDAAAVHKSGGGTGFSLGRIRGKGEAVSSTGRPAPGAVNVLRLYSDAIHRVTQAGMRPGANMMILPVDHPDIMEFITAKQTEGEIRNFNISVAMPDDFMMALIGNSLTADERAIWDAIVDGAWRNGEPGLFFIDTTNNAALHPEYIEATNPCGEVPLRPYEACVLGSVNLAAHIVGGQMDYATLDDTVKTLTEMLDNIIERQDYPLPEIKREQQRYRKIGVGVMGYADALCMMDVAYGSPRALDLAEEWMSRVQVTSYSMSRHLGKERGYYAGWKDDMPERRNLNCQVIAPTGTISRLAGCSFGIEPHFDVNDDGEYLSFIVGGVFTDYNPFYLHESFRPASQVTLQQHIDTQAAFQRFVDQAVSKTVNCPHETSRQDVADAYIQAWLAGCKGTTVLREGAREDVVIGAASTGDCVGGVCAV